ncbi:MAG: aldehyde ferredoxin oxidoreductase family protein [Bacillota bacterium]|nr:aldehyde ferredoxin oxidoreductase family protein [Bacillota bacterium]
MFKGGYTGKTLRINLSNQTYSFEPTSEDMARNFIGGAGFGIKTLLDEVSPDTDPLGPDNKLIFSSGPFCGTTIPCASRMTVTAKSPLTGAVGMALSGGYFPAEMKLAGYDTIIIEGKSEKPSYLWINNDKIIFRPADKVWNTRTFDCQQIIKDDLRDQNIRVAAIGPAGENLSNMACIINERRALGRKGMGAVMGSKNLKAIAIRGSNEIGIADPEAYEKALASMRKALRDSEVTYPKFSKFGTPLAYAVTSEMGIFATKNWSATGAWDPFDKLGLDAAEEMKIGRHRCYNCPVGCSQMSIAREGNYAGIMTEGPEYETVYSLGGTVGIDSFDAVIAGDRLCDELGLDSISAGVTIGWAMELYEKGLLTKEDTGGIDLRFGNDKAMMDLLIDMAYRRGFGALLTNGVRIAAEKIGKGSEKIAMHVKGLEMPAYDIRGAKAHGLNYATSYTGADHNRGYSNHEIFGIPVPAPVDRFAIEGKGRETVYNQDITASTCDSAPMCSFFLGQAFILDAADNTANLLKALTGIELSPDEVLKVGERITNVARVFNILAGLNRKDDTFPERILSEPIPEGNSKGQLISREDLNKMLDEYYEVRGWDKDGTPTAARLKELGLHKEAEKLVNK